MIYLDENKTKVLILSGRIANELLSRGYRIVQVLPDKQNRIKTVFVFETKNKLEDYVLALTERVDIF